MAARERPRAVFLDLDMPGLTGFEVLEGLRSGDGTRDIPVVIHTSRVLTDDERRRLAPAAAILSKECPSRDVAVARLRETLVRIGLAVEAMGTRHV